MQERFGTEGSYLWIDLYDEEFSDKGEAIEMARNFDYDNHLLRRVAEVQEKEVWNEQSGK